MLCPNSNYFLKLPQLQLPINEYWQGEKIGYQEDYQIIAHLKKQLPSAVTWIIFRPKASSCCLNSDISACFPAFFICSHKLGEKTKKKYGIRKLKSIRVLIRAFQSKFKLDWLYEIPGDFITYVGRFGSWFRFLVLCFNHTFLTKKKNLARLWCNFPKYWFWKLLKFRAEQKMENWEGEFCVSEPDVRFNSVYLWCQNGATAVFSFSGHHHL